MEYVRSTTLTLDSVNAEISSSLKLNTYLYVYGEGIFPCTKVQSITDSTHIVLNKNALKSGTYNLTYTDLNPGQYLERCEMLKGAEECAMSEGKLIEIIAREESGVSRGRLNSIQTKQQTPSLLIYAVNIQSVVI